MKNLRKKNPGQPGNMFDSHGTEGMLDVILGCTLIFILLTALIQADRGKNQEVSLPSIDLSKSSKVKAAGQNKIKRTVISVKSDAGQPRIFLDDREVEFPELDRELAKMKGVGHVALRRDRELPCKWEDQIIIRCRQAGISRVAIMVKAENGKKPAKN